MNVKIVKEKTNRLQEWKRMKFSSPCDLYDYLDFSGAYILILDTIEKSEDGGILVWLTRTTKEDWESAEGHKTLDSAISI